MVRERGGMVVAERHCQRIYGRNLYLRPELIGDLVKSLNGTIVECNTAYGGSRASAALHKQVAQNHGFTAIADFDLMDEDGEIALPLTGASG